MSNEAQDWQKVAAKLRRAMGLSEPTPEEAAEAMGTAGEAPMSEDEVGGIVRGVCDRRRPRRRASEPKQGWVDAINTEEMAEDTMLVMNRNAGDDDGAVDQELERLREEALANDDEEEDDEA